MLYEPIDKSTNPTIEDHEAKRVAAIMAFHAEIERMNAILLTNDFGEDRFDHMRLPDTAADRHAETVDLSESAWNNGSHYSRRGM